MLRRESRISSLSRQGGIDMMLIDKDPRLPGDDRFGGRRPRFTPRRRRRAPDARLLY